MKKEFSLRNIKQWTPLSSLIMLILFLLINLIMGNLDYFFIKSFISINIAVICLAIGVSVVIIGGGMDISMGAIVSLINVIFVVLNVNFKFGLGITILICICCSVLLGLINAFIISILNVTPLLATFATTSVFAGLALWIKPVPGGMVSLKFVNWYNSTLFYLPVSIIFPILLLVIWFFVKKSKLGLWIYAMGNNESKSFVSGIPVKWVKFCIYSFSGFAAGIGGIALTANVGAGDPLIGLSLALSSIAACVIGGIAMTGGSGKVSGSIFGALFLGIVLTTVLSLDIDPYFQELVTGLIILFGIIGSILVINRTQTSKIKDVKK